MWEAFKLIAEIEFFFVVFAPKLLLAEAKAKVFLFSSKFPQKLSGTAGVKRAEALAVRFMTDDFAK
jgi:hypothetical protein